MAGEENAAMLQTPFRPNLRQIMIFRVRADDAAQVACSQAAESVLKQNHLFLLRLCGGSPKDRDCATYKYKFHVSV